MTWRGDGGGGSGGGGGGGSGGGAGGLGAFPVTDMWYAGRSRPWEALKLGCAAGSLGYRRHLPIELLGVQSFIS